jgi:hypothetical protein
MKLATGIVALWLLVALPAAVAQAQKAFPKGGPKGVPKGMPKGDAMKKGGGGVRLTPNPQVERLLAMPPEQRDRVLEKLPSNQQTALRKRFEQFDKLPPEERAHRIEMWKKFESLTPEKRELVTKQMSAVSALPEDRGVMVKRALNNLSRLTPEERQARLNSPAFKERFSPEEHQMISDLVENWMSGKERGLGVRARRPAAQILRGLRAGFDQGCLGDGLSCLIDVRIQHFLELTLGHGADALFHHLPAFEDEQRGNAHDAVAHRGAAVGIDVQLADLDLANVIVGDGIDRRRHLPARTAPFGPEVHQDGDIAAEHILIEIRVGEVKCVLTCHFLS